MPRPIFAHLLALIATLDAGAAAPPAVTASWQPEGVANSTWTFRTAALALGQGGAARVVFIDPDPPGGIERLLLTERQADGSWAPRILHQGSAIDTLTLGLAVDGTGATHLAFVTSSGEAPEVHYVRVVGKTVEEETLATAVNPTVVALTVDGQGVPALAWSDDFGVHLARRTVDGGTATWSDDVVDPDAVLGGCSGGCLRLAVDVDDSIHVAYAAWGDVWYARRDQGAWFRSRVAGAPEVDGRGASLALVAGVPHVLFWDMMGEQRGEETVYALRHAWLDGDGWKKDLVATASDASGAALAAAPEGRVMAAWPTGGGTLRFAMRDGDTWLPATVHLEREATTYGTDTLPVLLAPTAGQVRLLTPVIDGESFELIHIVGTVSLGAPPIEATDVRVAIESAPGMAPGLPTANHATLRSNGTVPVVALVALTPPQGVALGVVSPPSGGKVVESTPDGALVAVPLSPGGTAKVYFGATLQAAAVALPGGAPDAPVALGESLAFTATVAGTLTPADWAASAGLPTHDLLQLASGATSAWRETFAARSAKDQATTVGELRAMGFAALADSLALEAAFPQLQEGKADDPSPPPLAEAFAAAEEAAKEAAEAISSGARACTGWRTHGAGRLAIGRDMEVLVQFESGDPALPTPPPHDPDWPPHVILVQRGDDGRVIRVVVEEAPPELLSSDPDMDESVALAEILLGDEVMILRDGWQGLHADSPDLYEEVLESRLRQAVTDGFTAGMRGDRCHGEPTPEPVSDLMLFNALGAMAGQEQYDQAPGEALVEDLEDLGRAIGSVIAATPATPKTLARLRGLVVKAIVELAQAYGGRLPAWEVAMSLAAVGLFDRLGAGEECDRACTTVVASIDPNDLQTVPAPGPLPGSATLDLLIRFENEAAATAPAHDVTIDIPLDPAVDPSSVTVTDASHAGLIGPMVVGDRIRCVFAGIDLPPNAAPPDGEGLLGLRLRVRDDLPTGTHVSSRASIVFDGNPPIATATRVHVIDATAPRTRLDVRDAGFDGTHALAELHWQSDDNAGGAGVAKVTVLGASSGTGFLPVAPASTGETVTFASPPGQTWTLVALAVDHAGNREPIVGAAPVIWTAPSTPATDEGGCRAAPRPTSTWSLWLAMPLAFAALRVRRRSMARVTDRHRRRHGAVA